MPNYSIISEEAATLSDGEWLYGFGAGPSSQPMNRPGFLLDLSALGNELAKILLRIRFRVTGLEEGAGFTFHFYLNRAPSPQMPYIPPNPDHTATVQVSGGMVEWSAVEERQPRLEGKRILVLVLGPLSTGWSVLPPIEVIYHAIEAPEFSAGHEEERL